MGSRNRSMRRQLRQAMSQADKIVPSGILRNGTNGKTHDQILVEELLLNASMARQDWMNSQIDPRRDINDECGYPETITVALCKQLYDRDSIAARVVQVFPRECWAIQPTVYEDEDSEVVTTFEQAWDTLGKNLLGEESKFKQEKGSPIWEYFKRLDTLAGIGTFGVMLLGFDDGLPTWMPVAGFEDGLPTVPDDPKQKQDAEKMQSEEQEIKSAEGTVDGSMQGLKMDGSPMGTDAQYYDSFGYKIIDGPIPQSKLSKKKKPSPSTKSPTGNFGGPPAPASTPHNPYLGPKEYEDEQQEADDEEGQSDDQEMEEGQEQFGQDTSETVVGAEAEDATEFTPKVKLLYLRCFDETSVQVVQYESDPHSPRYGQPVRYLITLNDSRTQHGGIGLPMNSIYVHWSRVLHFTDTHWQENSSEVYAPMRLECVFNRVWDLVKTYGGGAEAFWRGAIPGLSIETHPSLGGDVVVDKAGLKDMMEQRNNGMQRDIFLMGMSAKSLPPSVTDPTAHVKVHINAICIKIGIPERIFMGSERGELASGQDDSTWNDRVKERQTNLLTPRMIVPFVDRMVRVGCLPEPLGYCVEWPDLNAASDLEKAQIATARFDALTKYVQGNLESLITPVDALSKIGMMVTEDEAKAMLDSAADAVEDRMTTDPNELMQQQMEGEQDLAQQAIDKGLNPAGETTQIGDTHEHIYPEGSKAGVQQPPQQGGEGNPQEDNGGFPPKKGPPQGPPQSGGFPHKKKLPFTKNAFCPTGEGGGQDNSCGPAKGSQGEDRAKAKDAGDAARTKSFRAKKTMSTDITSSSREEIVAKSEKAVNAAVKAHEKASKLFEKAGDQGMSESHKTEAKKLLSSLRTLKSMYGQNSYTNLGRGVVDNEDEVEGLSAYVDESMDVENAFCPTGLGGGVDATCSPSSTTSKGESLHSATRGEDKVWRLGNGQKVPEHIQKLGIPPAWKNVQVNLDPKGDLFAKGEDAKGRVQMKYSASHNSRQAAAKFGRTRELLKKREGIYKELNKDAKNPELKDRAECLKLVMQTGMRPGSDGDTLADHKSYGATTLEGKHVVDNRDGTVTLRLVTGKNKGREVDFHVSDKETASMLLSRASKAGKDGRLFDTDAGSLRSYSKSKDGKGFKTKDHRTALGTETAIRAIKEHAEPPATMKEYKARVKDIATRVSKTLGNTPSVALKSYIDPQVFTAWQKNLKLKVK